MSRYIKRKPGHVLAEVGIAVRNSAILQAHKQEDNGLGGSWRWEELGPTSIVSALCINPLSPHSTVASLVSSICPSSFVPQRWFTGFRDQLTALIENNLTGT
jgi:hypothetical protein